MWPSTAGRPAERRLGGRGTNRPFGIPEFWNGRMSWPINFRHTRPRPPCLCPLLLLLLLERTHIPIRTVQMARIHNDLPPMNPSKVCWTKPCTLLSRLCNEHRCLHGLSLRSHAKQYHLPIKLLLCTISCYNKKLCTIIIFWRFLSSSNPKSKSNRRSVPKHTNSPYHTHLSLSLPLTVSFNQEPFVKLFHIPPRTPACPGFCSAHFAVS